MLCGGLDMGLLKNSRRKITSCLGYSLAYHLIEASNGITKSGGVPCDHEANCAQNFACKALSRLLFFEDWGMYQS